MNDESKRKFLAQFEASRKSIEQWPEWMRETAKLAYATLPRSGAVCTPPQYRLPETDIYDFAGWLTTRDGVMTVGRTSEAWQMAEAVGEYLRTFPERFAAALVPPRSES